MDREDVEPARRARSRRRRGRAVVVGLVVAGLAVAAGCADAESRTAAPPATVSAAATQPPVPVRSAPPEPLPPAPVPEAPVAEPPPEAGPEVSPTPEPEPAAPVAPERVAPAPAPPPPPPVAPSTGSPSTGGAQQLFGALNAERAAAGLAPLAYDGSLEASASSWSAAMSSAGTMSHNPSVGSQIRSGWRSWGENVAYAGGYADNAATIHAGWMNSPPHRANILSAGFTHVGIGYVVDAAGTAWATQVFATY